jgi:ATP-dependent Lon protease
MSELPEDMLFQAENFSGKARLFPLPNLVLFPHVLQLLHVFEARYRDLVEEALAADRLIAMALLAPGWEADYEGRPPIHPMACLGRIVTHHRLEDGRYNLLLAGVHRIRLLRELAPDKSFREAEAETCEDAYSSHGALARPALRRRLLETFRGMASTLDEAHSQLEPLLAGEISLGMLTDLVAYTLELSVATKQRLLSEADVDRRAELLLSVLADPANRRAACNAPANRFPPGFSMN